MRSRLLLVLFLVSPTLLAQDLSQFEKVLVPVLNNNPIHGANGSTFATTFGILSDNVFDPFSFYPTGATTPQIGKSFAQILEVVPWEAPVIAHGRFLFVEQRVAKAPMFADVAATAPDGSIARTQIPVVHERDVLIGKSTFGLIPNDATNSGGYRQRHTLRIYDFDSRGDMRVVVRMRFASWLSRGVIAEQTIAIDQRDANDISYPYFVEADLERSFGSDWCYPGLRGCTSFDAIIEVEPLRATDRYFAFISTTDNATNHIAIYTAR